ncbi:chemotaxis protein CheB [Desulfococcus sp.]|uniref:chemotaxis protein CheB n=1 Tax=Desulfococcus sp. TaxID=2025834 RepID=UPI0035931594
MTNRKKDPSEAAIPPGDAGAIETRECAAASAESQERVESTSAYFPIVGIGASAGGLAAFESFFSGMPADTDPGMAFILVQHLAPDHKSILTNLVQRYTRMQVFEVEDGMAVRPNCAYIIPPGRDMAFLGGALQLLEPSAPRGQRMPIDFFFRSLAQDQRERAIGIVLSGTGSDGTLGVRAIKGEGGMVMAQTPASTAYDGMPRSALATGLVDYELPPAEMAAQLIAYAAHAFGIPRSPAVASPPRVENALKKIFILLRAHTGHDFSQYKPSTVHRRIERRMAIHQIETMDGYVKFLQQTPIEVEALFRDMLIGVTSFFRDPAAFEAIQEQILPKLFSGKSSNCVIRVWSAGCSTGEEAYSLAILLAELQEKLKQSFKVQIFATDIDSQSIVTARAGLYPASIDADISPERLARFFSVEPDGSFYRIHKNIRDMVVFSEQNVIKDPPFSKLDLISCRNLLIYMGAELQKKIIPLFHYALNPCGFLFLGTSESVGEFGHLFTTLDRIAKLYQRREDFHPAGPYRFLPPMTAADALLPPATPKSAYPGKPSLRELTEQALLRHVAPVAALVNGNGDILYLHGRTGLYLEPAPGESGVNNILKMAREGLRRELATALRKVAAGEEVVRCPNLRVKTNGDVTATDLTVRTVPLATPAAHAGASEAPLMLVILEQGAPLQRGEDALTVLSATEAVAGIEAGDEAHALIASLRQELQAKEEYLQTASEELETANEELKSSNEEMQSVNEELQSTNEELETSKEELVSVNEELSTVNAELQTKVADLSRTNNDMNNLLSGTGIATVFVDQSLRILRFTPTATRIINLIHSDIGRPVGHIVSNLTGYDALSADTQAVLDTLAPKEAEVQTRAGGWHTMRILPYRTLDNVIEGAVITFVDISPAKQAQEALHDAHIRVTEAIVATVHEPLLMLDPDLRIISASRSFYSTFRAAPDSANGRLLYDLGNRRWDIPALRNLLETILPRDSVVNNYILSHEFEAIGLRTIRINARMVSEADRPGFILLAMEDITEAKNEGGAP